MLYRYDMNPNMYCIAHIYVRIYSCCPCCPGSFSLILPIIPFFSGFCSLASPWCWQPGAPVKLAGVCWSLCPPGSFSFILSFSPFFLLPPCPSSSDCKKPLITIIIKISKSRQTKNSKHFLFIFKKKKEKKKTLRMQSAAKNFLKYAS